MCAQAVATGYGNRLEATRAHVPWRPAPLDRPKAPGPLVAEVVGASGGAAGNDEIYTDRLGRIAIRHDFQPAGEGSSWVRVVQPLAGAGMGLQFIPRIGQQVLVGQGGDEEFCGAREAELHASANESQHPVRRMFAQGDEFGQPSGSFILSRL